MNEDFRDMWNVFELDNEELIELINRTSNSLERYNRWMKHNVFRVQHPSLMKFVEGLYAEGMRQVKRVEDVQKGREIPAEPKGVTSPLFQQNTMSTVRELVREIKKEQRKGLHPYV